MSISKGWATSFVPYILDRQHGRKFVPKSSADPRYGLQTMSCPNISSNPMECSARSSRLLAFGLGLSGPVLERGLVADPWGTGWDLVALVPVAYESGTIGDLVAKIVLDWVGC